MVCNLKLEIFVFISANLIKNFYFNSYHILRIVLNIKDI